MKKNKRNRGTTMMEIIVGFTVLMILDAGFLKIIGVSNQIYYRGVDMMRETQQFISELYRTDKGSLTEKTLSVDVVLSEVSENGTKQGREIALTNAKLTRYSGDAFAGEASRPVTVYEWER